MEYLLYPCKDWTSIEILAVLGWVYLVTRCWVCRDGYKITGCKKWMIWVFVFYEDHYTAHPSSSSSLCTGFSGPLSPVAHFWISTFYSIYVYIWNLTYIFFLKIIFSSYFFPMQYGPQNCKSCVQRSMFASKHQVRWFLLFLKLSCWHVVLHFTV